MLWVCHPSYSRSDIADSIYLVYERSSLKVKERVSMNKTVNTGTWLGWLILMIFVINMDLCEVNDHLYNSNEKLDTIISILEKQHDKKKEALDTSP